MGVYCTLCKGFHIFVRGVQLCSLAELMPMQIAQAKINVDRFLTYIVREDSQINLVILSDPNPLSQEMSHSIGVNSKKLCFQKFQYFNVNLR